MPRDFPRLELETLATVADMGEMSAEGRRLSLSFVEALLVQSTLWVWRGGKGAPRYRLGLKEFATVLEQRRPEAVARARMSGACLDAVEALASALVTVAGAAPLRRRFETLPIGDVTLWALGGDAAQASESCAP